MDIKNPDPYYYIILSATSVLGLWDVFGREEGTLPVTEGGRKRRGKTVWYLSIWIESKLVCMDSS